MSETEVSAEPKEYVEPFSLYLELEDGQLADLEIAARSVLALSAAIREAIFVIDPSINLNIVLLSGTEGSFSFNTFLKAIKPKDILSRINLKAVTIACFIWFSVQTAEYTYEKILDHFFDAPETDEYLSEKDREDIAQKVYIILAKKIAQEQVRNVFGTLDQDAAIKGVGATRRHGTKPIYIIPKGEFQRRSLVFPSKEERKETRVLKKEVVLTIISPVLIDESPRRWRFLGPEGEFGASIKDEVFLKSLTHGNVIVPMVSDVRLRVVLDINEEFDDGAWRITDRSISKVIDIIPPPFFGEPDLLNGPLLPTPGNDQKKDTK